MLFSPLAIVNALSFKSPRSERIASGLAYGPHPAQRLDLYRPRRPKAPLGTIVFIFGGAWNEGAREENAFVGRWLAALGYLVVIPDYRLTPAYAYPAFLDDSAAATRWALENAKRHGGDPDRLVLMGFSAGAYNAVMAAISPDYGLSPRLKGVVGLSGPYDFYPFDIDITERTFGHVADPLSTQPVNLVTAGLPPMFLGCGEADRLVYPRNTVALSARLRAAGVAVEERHYPRATHPTLLLALGSLLPAPRAIRADLSAWLARTIGRV
jgi:acetyl esterase/lipase